MIAAQLDLQPLIAQGLFGNPHAEAWHILTAKNGIRDRTYPTTTRLNFRAAHHTFYDILRIVCNSTFEEKSGPFQPIGDWNKNLDVNMKYEDPTLYDLELYFFRQLIRMQKKMARWQAKQMRFWSRLDEDPESPIFSEETDEGDEADAEKELSNEMTVEQNQMIREKLAKYGGVHEQDIAKYAVSAAANYLGINSMSVAYMGSVGAHALATKLALAGMAHGFGTMSVAFGSIMGPWGMAGVVILAGVGVNYMLGSSEGALLEPLVAMLNQRFVLAMESIDIRTYHTFIEVEGLGLCHPLPIDPAEEKRARQAADKKVEAHNEQTEVAEKEEQLINLD